MCLSIQPCQHRSAIVGIHSNERLYYPFSVSVNKCGRSCNINDDPYALICVPYKVKTMNVKVFNLKFGVNETRV